MPQILKYHNINNLDLMMTNEENEKIFDRCRTETKSEKEKNKRTVPSDSTEQYRQIIGPNDLHPQRRNELSLKLLKEAKLQIDQRFFDDMQIIQLNRCTPNYQAVCLEVTFGFFKIQIDLLNVSNTSFSHQCPVINSFFASIYVYEANPNQKYSIKCFIVKNEKQIYRVIANAIKEYCLLKIASILRIGPHLPKLFGFDIVVYDNCVQFAMEYCEKAVKFTKQDAKMLKNKLSLLHSFGVIHFDIKPANIMFSNTLKEYVFIDFGLSECIREKIGFKTETGFIGSLKYCSAQMWKLYQSNKKGIIDLYLNDSISLMNSIEEMLAIQEQNQIRKTNQDEMYYNITSMIDDVIFSDEKTQKIQSQLLEMRIKHYLFYYLELPRQKIEPHSLQRHFCLRIASFMRMLPFSQKLLNYVDQLEKFSKEKDKDYLNLAELKAEIRRKKMHLLPNKNYCLDAQKERLSCLFQEKENQLKDYAYVKKSQRNRWVLIQKDAAEQERPYYIKCFADFVDILHGYSLFKQKIIAAQIFATICKIPKGTIEINSKYNQVERSWKYIFQNCVSEGNVYYEDIIPITVRNLILIGGWNAEKATIQCQKIFSMKFDCNFNGFLLYDRLIKSLYWLIRRLDTKYNQYQKIEKIIGKINQQMIIKKYNLYLSKLGELRYTIEIHFQNQKCLNFQQLKQIFIEIYISEENIENMIISILFAGNRQQKLLQNYFSKEYLLELVDRYEHITNKKYYIDYYHIKLIDFVNEDIQQSVISHTYKRFCHCFQKEKLLKLYEIYYVYENVANNMVSFKQYSAKMAQDIANVSLQINSQKRKEKGKIQVNSEMQKYNLVKVVQTYNCLSQNMFTNKEPNKKIIQKIKQSLEQIVTPHFLSELLIKELNCYVFQVIAFCLMLNEVYCFLYKKQQFCVPNSLLFCKQLGKIYSLSKISQDQRIKVDFLMIIIKSEDIFLSQQNLSFFLKLHQFIHQRIELPLYQNQTKNNQFKQHVHFIFWYYINILELAQRNHIEIAQAKLRYFRAVSKDHDYQIQLLFTKENSLKNFFHLNQSSLIQKSVEKFMNFQLLLVSYLGQHPYSKNILLYVKSILLMNENEEFSGDKFQSQFWQISQQSKYHSLYMFILYSIVLKNQTPKSFYNAKVDAILKKMCNSAEKMVPIAKRIVKENIAGYILTNEKMLKGNRKYPSKKRQIYYLKQLMKWSGNLPLKMNADILIANKKQFKKNLNLQNNLFQSKVQEWFKLIAGKFQDKCIF